MSVGRRESNHTSTGQGSLLKLLGIDNSRPDRGCTGDDRSLEAAGKGEQDW